MPFDFPVAQGRFPRFATTRWSLVLQAKERPLVGANEALADLCRAYWYPIYALFRRRSRNSHEAQDLTQSFFAKLLEKAFLDSVDPARGRFRSFLLAAVNHFFANEWDRKNTLKRGGGQAILSLDVRAFDWESGESKYQMEPGHHLTPEREFERRWALAVLDRVLQRLRDEYIDLGKLSLFETLQPYLSTDREQARYADAAEKLNATDSAIRVATHRLRKRYRDLLRNEIAQTVASPSEVEDELQQLFIALSSS
ncbi:RNA polymerase sigma factor [Schlesneria paludicola]|uniref:RNA polymerase sigma factor n=1 Tax=Schlesneria paludicola TaxID=360056 RepID=UPI00029A77F8|nr:sigma-70 family RNA polymerase sigma factor [Schlesneria paludicola]